MPMSWTLVKSGYEGGLDCVYAHELDSVERTGTYPRAWLPLRPRRALWSYISLDEKERVRD
uniref:Uncharacterized protein n=1 Tax=Anguilla anguilla TaxID=7936 RepID=A0A0E9QLS2_ANGAN